MSKLLAQLPADYQKIREFRELSNTVTVEYNSVATAFEQVENDQFVMSSSEPAIARRERDFDILPDLSAETLPFRKQRVLTRVQENAPYTLEYLKNLLNNLLGNQLSNLDLDIVKSEMEIAISANRSMFYKEVKKMTERIVPLNINLSMVILIVAEIVFLIDDSYIYPNHYPETGELLPEKDYTQIAALPIDVQDDSYGFEIQYPEAERGVSQADAGVASASDDAYGYQIDYPEIGEAELLQKPVTQFTNHSSVKSVAYVFSVVYPECGEYELEGED